MRTIVLISCVSKKRATRTTASDLYTSPLFKLNLAYAMGLKSDAVFILSAKYGLLTLDDEVEPYDLTLNTMPLAEVKIWAGNVICKIDARADRRNDRFILLAGERYRRYIVPNLVTYEVPMKGLTIGRQLRFLKDRIHE